MDWCVRLTDLLAWFYGF